MGRAGNQTITAVKLYDSELDGAYIEVDHSLAKLTRRNAVLIRDQEEVRQVRHQLQSEKARSKRLTLVWPSIHWCGGVGLTLRWHVRVGAGGDTVDAGAGRARHRTGTVPLVTFHSSGAADAKIAGELGVRSN